MLIMLCEAFTRHAQCQNEPLNKHSQGLKGVGTETLFTCRGSFIETGTFGQ